MSENTFNKTVFSNGDRLYAEQMNEISNAIENIYSILNAQPVLAYTNDCPAQQFFKLNEERWIKISFTTGAPGLVTIRVTKNNQPYKTFTTSKGVIDILLDPLIEDEIATYRVTGTDSLGNNPIDPAYLDFNVVTGGLVFYTDFLTTLNKQAILQNETGLLSFIYTLKYVDNSPGTRELRYKIVHNETNEVIKDNLSNALIFEENQIDAALVIDDINLSKLGKYTLEFIATCRISGLTFETIETYEFNVLQKNTANATIISSFFGDTNFRNTINFRVESGYDAGVILLAECWILDKNDNIKNPSNFSVSHGQEIKWEIGKLALTDMISSSQEDFTYFIVIYPYDEPRPGLLTYPYQSNTFTITKGEMGSSYVTRKLLAYFDTTSRQNTNNNRDTWESIDGSKHCYFKLNDMNYASDDGWINDAYFGDSVLAMKGESSGCLYTNNSGTETPYNPMAELKWNDMYENNGYDVNNPNPNYQQFYNEGFSIELQYKTRNIGNFDAQVLSCRPIDTVYNGVNFGHSAVSLSTTDKVVSTDIVEDRWQHVVLVFDKLKRFINPTKTDQDIEIENFNPMPSLRIYVNGVLTKVENFKYGKSGECGDNFNNTANPLLPFILNAKPIQQTGAVNHDAHGECFIKTLRLYNTGLTSYEVYQNYLSCLPLALQSETINKNSLESTNIPVIYFVKNPEPIKNKEGLYKDDIYYEYSDFNRINSFSTDQKNQSKATFVNCTVYYYYYENGVQLLEKYTNADISLQGTSSLAYPVKNYQIRNYNPLVASEKAPFTPQGNGKANWYPDYTYTLKCDYMEQSHKNNTPTAVYNDRVVDAVKTHLGSQGEYSPARQVEGFRDAIDGFPCLVYYNNNPNNDVTEANLKSHSANEYAGSFMFNIDKAGDGLGFKANENLICVSYEGASNNNVSASTFYTLEEAMAANATEETTLDKYYKETMEPRYSWDEDSKITLSDGTTKIKTQYGLLHNIINGLKQFEDFETITGLNELPQHKSTGITYTQEEYESLKTAFREFLEENFSLTYCMSYFLQLMVFAQIDNVGKNAMFDAWGTKDPSTGEITWGKIFPRPYDMDSQMGETNSGEDTIPVSAEISPVFSPESGLSKELPRYKSYNVTQSRLWVPFAICYWSQIRTAYQDLRSKGIYNANNIVNFVNGMTSDLIGERFYNRDAAAKYLSVYDDSGYISHLEKLQGNRENRYEVFLTKRLEFLDTYFDYRVNNIKEGQGESSIDTTQTVTANSPIIARCSPTTDQESSKNCTFTIATYQPCYVYINVDAKVNYVLYVDENSVNARGIEGRDFTINIPGNDKNIYIYSAGNIKNITNLDELKITTIDLANAKKLTNLTITSNNTLRKIAVKSNPFLQKIDLNNCTELTAFDFDTAVSKNIKTFNLNGCDKLNIGLTIENSALKTFSAIDSAISSLTLNNNTIFNELKIDNCLLLNTLQINACNKMTQFDLITANLQSLSSLSIQYCAALKELTIPNVHALSALNLTGNTALETLTAMNCSGSVFGSLNLSSLTGLKYLNLSGVTSTSGNTVKVRLPNITETWPGLLTLDISKSAVEVIEYGQTVTNNVLDLSGIQTKYNNDVKISGENLTMNGNTAAITITNLDYENDNLSSLFKDCYKLKNVSGKLTTYGTSLTDLFAITNGSQSILTSQSNYSTNLNLTGLSLVAPNVTEATNWFFRRTDIGPLEESGIRPLLNSMPEVTDLSNTFMLYDNPNGRFRVDFYDSTGTAIDFFKLNDEFANGEGIVPKRKLTNLTYFFYGCGFGLTGKVPKEFLSSVATHSLTILRSAFQGTTIEDIDTTIFSQQNSLMDIGGLFSGCTKLKLRSAITAIRLSNATISGEGANNTFYSVNSFSKDTTKIYDSELIELIQKRFKNCTQLQNTFYDSYGITHLPAHLFDISEFRSNLTSLAGCFTSIDSLQTINDDVLRCTNTTHTFTKLTNLGGFIGSCVNLKHSFSSQFFSDVPKVTTIGATTTTTAGGGSITLPGIFQSLYGGQNNNVLNGNVYSAEIFAPLTLLTNVNNVFYTSADKNANGWKNYNYDKTVRFLYTYSPDGGQTTATLESTMIPSHLFKNNRSIIYANYLFAQSNIDGIGTVINTDGLYSVSDETNTDNIKNFFPNSIQQMSYAFYNTYRLSKDIYKHIFRGKTNLRYINYTFQNSKIVGDIPENIFSGCSNLLEARYTFYNCTELGKMQTPNWKFPCNLFDSCRASLQSAEGTFQNAGLHGILTETAGKKSLFEDCQSLTNCQNFFAGCSNLQGKIPQNMFKNSTGETKLTKINKLFYNCCALTVGADGGGYTVEGKTYLVPPTWLQNCTALEEADYLFMNVGYLSTTYNWSNFSEDTKAMFYENPVNMSGIKVSLPTYEFPTVLFNACSKIRTLKYAFNNMTGLTVSLSNKFLENCNSVENIYRIFYNTNITTLGTIDNYVFKPLVAGSSNNILQNAQFAFGGSGSTITTGYAPIPADLIKAHTSIVNNNSGLYGIFSNQTNSTFLTALEGTPYVTRDGNGNLVLNAMYNASLGKYAYQE